MYNVYKDIDSLYPGLVKICEKKIKGWNNHPNNRHRLIRQTTNSRPHEA